MRASKDELPVAFEDGTAYSRDIQWGELNVALEGWPAGLDCTEMFKGLPDDRCQCPHWGLVLKGRLRIKYADRDEILKAGDVYYMAPGHIPVVEEDCELAEFSPAGEYQKTMELVAANMAAVQQPA